MNKILKSLPPTLDALGLSKLLYVSVNTVLRDINRRPHKLPPFRKVGNKAIWVTLEVFKWLGCSCITLQIENNDLPEIKSIGQSLLDASENNQVKNKKKK